MQVNQSHPNHFKVNKAKAQTQSHITTTTSKTKPTSKSNL